MARYVARYEILLTNKYARFCILRVLSIMTVSFLFSDRGVMFGS
jgi:hypothetical protein